MRKSQSEKEAGNQVVFRGRNEKIYKNIEEFNQTAKELDQHPIDMANDEFLFFYCECSDERCSERIKATFVDYEKHHRNRDTFIVLPNHVVYEIEDVLIKNKEYWVVKKHDSPFQDTTKLQITKLRHSQIKKNQD